MTATPARATILALALLVTLPTVLGASPAVHSPREKMSATLVAALDREPGAHALPDGRVRVMLMGAPLPAPASAPSTRAAWDDHWRTASASMLGAARDFARAQHAEVLGEWPAAPAIEMILTLDQVEAAASLDAVTNLGLDWDGAIRLVDAPPVAADLGALASNSVSSIGAQTFWNAGFRGEGINLAIIDTGIDASHPMLLDALHACGSRVVKWKDFVSGQLAPYDDNGHGTHVSGTAAGTTQCGGQLDGVAPYVSLMGAKILSSSGGGTWAAAQAALQWAFDNGANVTSNSYGGGDSTDSRAVASLVDNLARAGMASSFAAGNSGPGPSTINWPGQADLALTVGAIDANRLVASFSSRGPCSDGRTCPDIMAPGVSITSSWPGGGTAILSGTSMATPHVAGASALITQATRALLFRSLLRPGDPGVVKSELEDLVVANADDLGVPGPDNAYGWGAINLSSVFQTILARSQANVVLDARITADRVRLGASTTTTFDLRNLGGKQADGHLVAVLQGPSGARTLEDAIVSVPGGALVSRTWTFAGDALPPGDHAVVFRFDYTARDPLTNATLDVQRAATLRFRVERAVLLVVKDAPPNATLGVPFDVLVTLRNVGNLPATSVDLLESVPRAYTTVPRAPQGALPNSLWSSPAAASRVTHLDGSSEMRFVVASSLAPGAAWNVTYSLDGLAQGTFALPSAATYGDDGVGTIRANVSTPQTVNYPSDGLVPRAASQAPMDIPTRAGTRHAVGAVD